LVTPASPRVALTTTTASPASSGVVEARSMGRAYSACVGGGRRGRRTAWAADGVGGGTAGVASGPSASVPSTARHGFAPSHPG
jgi:hypothetical protein